jgi:hypothetical protein
MISAAVDRYSRYLFKVRQYSCRTNTPHRRDINKIQTIQTSATITKQVEQAVYNYLQQASASMSYDSCGRSDLCRDDAASLLSAQLSLLTALLPKQLRWGPGSSCPGHKHVIPTSFILSICDPAKQQIAYAIDRSLLDRSTITNPYGVTYSGSSQTHKRSTQLNVHAKAVYPGRRWSSTLATMSAGEYTSPRGEP